MKISDLDATFSKYHPGQEPPKLVKAAFYGVEPVINEDGVELVWSLLKWFGDQNSQTEFDIDYNSEDYAGECGNYDDVLNILIDNGTISGNNPNIQLEINSEVNSIITWHIKDSDGAVLAESAMDLPDASVLPRLLDGSSHMQVRNDANLKTALNAVFGKHGNQSEIHPFFTTAEKH